jgi:hypothetical protein
VTLEVWLYAELQTVLLIRMSLHHHLRHTKRLVHLEPKHFVHSLRRRMTYFIAFATSLQAVAADPCLQAWIASTPIFDMAKVFQRELDSALKTPGWLLNTVMRLEGAVNASAELNLK